jgi:hypothetical protein
MKLYFLTLMEVLEGVSYNRTLILIYNLTGITWLEAGGNGVMRT